MSKAQKDITKCPDCGGRIKWTSTETGTKVPIDINVVAIHPNLRGGIAIITTDGKVVIGKLAMAGEKGSVLGYTSHASTCKSSKERERSVL